MKHLCLPILFLLILSDVSFGLEEVYNSDVNLLWLDQTIKYVFDESGQQKFSVEEKTAVRKEIDQLVRQLAPGCIVFRERSQQQMIGVEEHYFLFKRHYDIDGSKEKCAADRGKRKDSYGNVLPTRIYLAGDHCFKNGTILHEIFHALGAAHEHNRPDRDFFIDLNPTNMMVGAEGNFRIEKAYSRTDATPYDFFSILHYEETRAAVDNTKYVLRMKPAFEKVFGKEQPLKVENRTASPTDVYEISRIYECDVRPEVKDLYVDYLVRLTEALLESISKCRPIGKDGRCDVRKIALEIFNCYYTDVEFHMMEEKYSDLYWDRVSDMRSAWMKFTRRTRFADNTDDLACPELSESGGGMSFKVYKVCEPCNC